MSTLFASLAKGQVITFKKCPVGSYTKPNEPYIIEWKDKNSVYFRNQRTGGGTYDPAWAVNKAELA